MADVAAHVTVTLMLQDESLTGQGGVTERRELPLDNEVYDRFLDGPTSRRIGTVDFDPDTGAPLGPPARFIPSKSNPNQGGYDADPGQADVAGVPGDQRLRHGVRHHPDVRRA